MKINKIYNENCLETMAKMPDNFIDLTVTSPPYDNLREYKGYSFAFEEIAKELFRITKQGGVLVWIVGDATMNGTESGTSFKQALFFKEIGFNLHDTMIYQKVNYVPLTHNRYEQSFEFMFVLSKGVELIAIERKKQIEKHGFTAEHHAKHPEWYDEFQLTDAASTLSMRIIKSCCVPLNWDAEWFKKLCLRTYEERLIIAGALLASEWDRLDYLQKNNTGERV